MPDPAVVRAIWDLGVGGLLLLALWAVYKRKVRVEAEVLEDKAEADARLAEMRTDRDAWRSLAESFGSKVEALTDAVTKLAGRRTG